MTTQPLDVPEYETLRLLQFGSEQELRDAAIANAQAALPEWTPREGNTEVALIESLAVMLGPEILAMQLLPGRILEQLMGLYGVVRGVGSPVAGTVEFTVTNSAPTQVIPAGSRLRLSLPSTGESVDVLTVDELRIITTDTLTGTVAVVGELLGVTGNNTPAGTALQVVGALPFVERAVLAATLTGGAGQEDEREFTSRAAATLNRISSTLVLPDSFQYAAMTRPEVGRAKVLDLYNPAAPGSPAAGHVTLALAGPTGTVLTTDQKDTVAAWLQAQSLASLAVHIIDPTYTTVNLSVTVKGAVGYSIGEVQASVQAALTAWLDPMAWAWDAQALQYRMVSVIAAAPGVAEVLTVPATVNLAGVAPLPTPGVFTVTVQ